MTLQIQTLSLIYRFSLANSKNIVTIQDTWMDKIKAFQYENKYE